MSDTTAPVTPVEGETATPPAAPAAPPAPVEPPAGTFTQEQVNSIVAKAKADAKAAAEKAAADAGKTAEEKVADRIAELDARLAASAAAQKNALIKSEIVTAAAANNAVNAEVLVKLLGDQVEIDEAGNLTTDVNALVRTYLEANTYLVKAENPLPTAQGLGSKGGTTTTFTKADLDRLGTAGVKDLSDKDYEALLASLDEQAK